MGDVSVDFALHPAQMKVFSSPARFTVLAAGRRFGKTKLAIARASYRALDPRNTQRKPVFVIAPIQMQAKLLYWHELVSKLQPFVDHSHVNEGHIFLKNGVMIGVKGADNPDSLRGVGLYHVELDEFADMKPEVWDLIVRPALADVKGTAGFIGTPKGRNHFYDRFKYADESGDPEWAAFHFTSLDNPYLDKSEVESARTSMSANAFRQEFMSSFETGGADFFRREWVRTCDEPSELDKRGVSRLKEGDWFVTVDLAGFAALAEVRGYRQKRLDQHAIAVVKIHDDGTWWVRDVYLGRWGVEETARRIVDAVDSCKTMRLGIEKGALYNAVAPYLSAEANKRNVPLSPVPLSHENRNKVDRIAWALQGRMENSKIFFRQGAPWLRDLEDQVVHFPSQMVHDDALDALAFIVQLAEGSVFSRFAQMADEPYWVPEDAAVGF